MTNNNIQAHEHNNQTEQRFTAQPDKRHFERRLSGHSHRLKKDSTSIELIDRIYGIPEGAIRINYLNNRISVLEKINLSRNPAGQAELQLLKEIIKNPSNLNLQLIKHALNIDIAKVTKDIKLSKAMLANTPWGPKVGSITVGAYSPPAAISTKFGETRIVPSAPIAIYKRIYSEHSQTLTEKYGANLAQANYFGLGMPDFKQRIKNLRNWILLAQKTGVPTIAIELPKGNTTHQRLKNYSGINKDNPELIALKRMFQSLERRGITVKVRFASEANLYDSDYSATRDGASGIAFYRGAAKRFREMMPENMKMIFSPFINSATERSTYKTDSSLRKMLSMYDPKVYDYVGGTVYARPGGNVTRTYLRYYQEMRKLDPNAKFVICELGGPNQCQEQIKHLMELAVSGKFFSELKHVNLFLARNYRKPGILGKDNLIDPVTGKSFLRDVLSTQASA